MQVLEKLIKKEVLCTNITTKIFLNVNTDWKIQMTISDSCIPFLQIL